MLIGCPRGCTRVRLELAQIFTKCVKLGLNSIMDRQTMGLLKIFRVQWRVIVRISDIFSQRNTS